MLKRAFEWYRVVNPQPAQAVLDNRKAAVGNVVQVIRDADDWELALLCVSGAATGFDRFFGQESSVVRELVAAVKAHDSAFPEDLTENALELRTLAALSIGELVVGEEGKPPSNEALTIASAVDASLGAQSLPAAKYLKEMLVELRDAARRVLDEASRINREPRKPVGNPFSTLKEAEPPADLPTAWKNLLPLLRKSFDVLERQSAIDREELNILWWMFGGVSISTNQSILSMPLGAAAVCCAAELGTLCRLPPSSNLEAILRRSFEAGRNVEEMKPQGIERIAADWKDEHIHTFLPDDAARENAAKFPIIFPLSWLCIRLRESRHAQGWVGAFEEATGVMRSNNKAPSEWAAQILRERVASRTITESARS